MSKNIQLLNNLTSYFLIDKLLPGVNINEQVLLFLPVGV